MVTESSPTSGAGRAPRPLGSPWTGSGSIRILSPHPNAFTAEPLRPGRTGTILIWTRYDVLSALVLPVGIGLAVQASPAQSAPADAPTPVVQEAPSFADDIMPIFERSCVSCHGGFNEEAGEVVTEEMLDMTTYEGLMGGSQWGTVIEPGDAANSILYDMVLEGDMPEEGDPLPQEEIDLIGAWIDAGAENN